MIKKKSKPRKLYDKERQAAKLANKALKNKPVWKPAPGYKYLKDIEPGNMFLTSCGTKGVLLDCSVNAKVIILDVPTMSEEDKRYYLGKKIIGAETEVKEI